MEPNTLELFYIAFPLLLLLFVLVEAAFGKTRLSFYLARLQHLEAKATLIALRSDTQTSAEFLRLKRQLHCQIESAKTADLLSLYLFMRAKERGDLPNLEPAETRETNSETSLVVPEQVRTEFQTIRTQAENYLQARILYQTYPGIILSPVVYCLLIAYSILFKHNFRLPSIRKNVARTFHGLFPIRPFLIFQNSTARGGLPLS